MPEWLEWRDGDEPDTKNVFGYVPAAEIMKVIDAHGGADCLEPLGMTAPHATPPILPEIAAEPERPETRAVGEEFVLPWRPMETAPRNGDPFWGRVEDDAIRMLWHEGFQAFVSRWNRAEFHNGYVYADTGLPYQDHSPVIHQPDAWLPLPERTAALAAPSEETRAVGEGLIEHVRAYFSAKAWLAMYVNMTTPEALDEIETAADAMLRAEAAIRAALAAPSEETRAVGEEWCFDITSAPTDKEVLVCVRHSAGFLIVGEAIHAVFYPSGHPVDDDGWWWANTVRDYENYEPITPICWRPLPAPPAALAAPQDAAQGGVGG